MFSTRYQLIILWFAVLASLCGHAWGSEERIIKLEPSTQSILVGPHLYYLEDSQGSWSPQQVKAIPLSRWQKHDKDIFSQGYTSSVFWLTFFISSDHKGDYYLEFDLPFFGMIDFHVYRNGQLIDTVKTGLRRPLSQRAYPHEAFVLPIQTEPYSQYQILIRAESVSAMLAPLRLYGEQAFHQNHVNKNTFLGIYFGLALVLALYNFFLFMATHDRNFLLYTFHVIGLCWLQASLRGFTATHLWGDSFRDFAYYEPTAVIWASFCTSLAFTINFLKLPGLYPKLFRTLLICLVISLFFTIGTFWLPIEWVLASFNATSPLIIILIIGTAIYCLSKGNKAARFFLMAWSFFLVGALIKIVYHLGLLPTNFLTTNPMIIGSAIEGVLLSLALADRFNWIQKEKEEAQKQAVLALEQSNRLKDDFLVSISHEMRTPLAGITGAVSLSKAARSLSEIHTCLELIEVSSERITETIDNVLCLSELNSGEVKIHDSDFNAHSLLKDIVENIHLQCQEKHLDFTYNNTLEPTQVFRGDVSKLRIILRCVLQNAVNFTPKGSIQFDIKQVASKNQAYLNFIVQDSGIGIPKDKQEQIFEAFKQLSGGYSRTHEGLGIGLTITQRLLKLLNGHLIIDSNGNGTLIKISVPVTRIADEAESAKPVPPDAELKVLVIEDNPVNQKVLVGILRKLGCKVALSANGREGLEQALQDMPDIVFMDIQMPVMDGIEATKALRKRYTPDQLPIIAVTANTLSNDRERCSNAGMNDYLAKPVNMEHLKAILQKWAFIPLQSTGRTTRPT